MKPTSKSQHLKVTTSSSSEIKELSPQKTIVKKTDETKNSIRKGLNSAPNIALSGIHRERLIQELTRTTKPDLFSDALMINNPKEQKEAFDSILAGIRDFSLEGKVPEDFFGRVWDRACAILELEDSDSNIKDMEPLRDFCIKFIIEYYHIYHSDNLIKDINRLKINQYVWLAIIEDDEIEWYKCSGLQAALQITDKEKQQEALFIVATKGLKTFDCSEEDECHAVLNAARQITDDEKRRNAFCKLVQHGWMNTIFKAALNVTEANDRKEILFGFVEAARFLNDPSKLNYIFNKLRDWKDEYGLKKRLESLPVDTLSSGRES